MKKPKLLRRYERAREIWNHYISVSMSRVSDKAIQDLVLKAERRYIDLLKRCSKQGLITERG